MNNTSLKLNDIYSRIPRRHNTDNVKEINEIINEYEDILIELEALPAYESIIPTYFEALDPIRILVKKSNENKNSKKQKDDIFDEASGDLKDTVAALQAFINQ